MSLIGGAPRNSIFGHVGGAPRHRVFGCAIGAPRNRVFEECHGREHRVFGNLGCFIGYFCFFSVLTYI